MQLLRSRLPYMTDETWTKLVMKRAAEEAMAEGQFDSQPHTDLERIELAQIKLVKSKRIEELGFAMDPTVNLRAGATETISMGETRLVREAFKKEGDADKIAADFNITADLVMDAVNGKVWAYAGGPLRPPTMCGLHVESSGYTTNQRRFIKSAIALAHRELDDNKFEIFCNNNGMEVSEAKQLFQDLEKRNVRLNQQRYRGVLVRHSEGEDVEKCIVAYKRKARAPGGSS